MIQVYEKDNTNYDKNGNTIFPMSCSLSVKLNSTWEMILTHPIDQEERWKGITEEAVICAPTWIGNKQLFRISEVEKTDTEVRAMAYPIFFDSANDCFLMDVRPEVKNGQQALNIMTSNSRYSGKSDITHASTAYFVRRNLMDAINGEDEPTFIQRWGGEMLYDNYEIIINERVGGDFGTEIRYGKNMNGINYALDMSEIVTRIVPVSYNGHSISGDEPWIDSANIGKYVKIYIREMKFEDVKMREDASEDDEDKGIIICDTQKELDEALTKKCKEQYELGVDLPRVTIDVNMADLSRTVEYKDYMMLEKVGLGDTVHCRHSKLGITTDARVIELTWDCIRNIPRDIVLGDYTYDYFSELTSSAEAIKKVIGPGNTLVAERVNGVLNAINTQLKYQKNIAQKQDIRAVLFEDIDSSSSTYGAMCLGTQGFQIANKRTQDGRDWDWSTAFTAKGGYADVLVAGLLSDKTGRSFWNLDTGEIQLTGVLRQFATNGYKSIDIVNNQIRAYAWHSNGDFAGAIGSLRGRDEYDGRTYMAMWANKGDVLLLGYDTPDSTYVKRIMSFDTNDERKTPYIINTASGTIFKDNPSGGIIVENGLIKSWNFKAATGTMSLKDSDGNTTVSVDVANGLITGWRTS